MQNSQEKMILDKFSSFYLAGKQLIEVIDKIILNEPKIIFVIHDNEFTQKFRCKIENVIKSHLDILNLTEVNFLYKILSKENFFSSNCPKDTKNKIRLANIKNIITLVSCKGGVGKSTNVINLAYALSKKYKVGILDADIYGPSIPRMTNLNTPPKLINNLIEPLISNNIKIMSLGFMIEKNIAAIWRGPILSKSIIRLFNETNWGEIDYLLIDTPPGTGDVHLTIGEKFIIDGAIIITTPQKIATDEAERMINMLEKLDISIYGVIENMSYITINGEKNYLFGKEGGKLLAEKKHLDFLASIELDIKMTEMLDLGRYEDISQSLQNEYFKIVKLLEKNLF